MWAKLNDQIPLVEITVPHVLYSWDSANACQRLLCIGNETQTSRANTISLYCHRSTDTIKLKWSSMTKIWNMKSHWHVGASPSFIIWWNLGVRMELQLMVNMQRLLFPHANIFAVFFQNKAASPAPENAPMQAHKCKTNHPHARARLDKHWPSTLHEVREWQWFTSAWLNCNWNCEETKSKSQSEERESGMGSGASESVNSGRVQWQSVKPQRRELGWIHSAVGCQPQQLLHGRSDAGPEVAHLRI